MLTVVFENGTFFFFRIWYFSAFPHCCSFSVALPPTATLTFTQLLSSSLLCRLLVPSVLVHSFFILFVHGFFSVCLLLVFSLSLFSRQVMMCNMAVGRFHKLVKTGYTPKCIDLQPTYGGCLTCQSVHAVISLDCSMWEPVDPWECRKPVGKVGSLLPSFSPSSSRLRPCSWNCGDLPAPWVKEYYFFFYFCVQACSVMVLPWLLGLVVWIQRLWSPEVLRVASDSELFLHLQHCLMGWLLHSCWTLKTANSKLSACLP